MLFHVWRRDADVAIRATFVLNQPAYAGGTVLIAGRNFGCGSSREHAVWALADHGFRSVIAPSFADIFFSNCYKNGFLPIVLPAAPLDTLFAAVASNPRLFLTVDLPEQSLRWPGGEARFDIDPLRK